jgi:hypothetical protein
MSDEIRTTLKGMQTKEHDKIVSRLTGRTHEIQFGPLPSTMEGHTGSAGGLVPKNPFASAAQRGYLHANPEVLGAKKLAEFDAASKGQKVPYKVKKGK